MWYIRSEKMLIFLMLWWFVFAAFSFGGFHFGGLLTIVGFTALFIVPGMLTLILFCQTDHPWPILAPLIVGLSTLELMFVGLLTNTLVPLIDIARPLDHHILLACLSLWVLELLYLCILFRSHTVPLRHVAIPRNVRSYVTVLVPVVFVIGAVLGAVSLNNGGTGLYTLATLFGITLYLAYFLFRFKDWKGDTAPIILFLISLAVLLMTSLRSWYLSGHDVMWEYKVFELTKQSGIWNIDAYRDAYNACLSITILPTLVANLLSIPDPYVYKFWFQILFAFVPVLAYVIARRFLMPRLAFIAALYFIAFPTFFWDMPFLIRQEIAFLFFGLMLAVIFEPSFDMAWRRALFVLLALGAILSHYSTTYTVLFVFIGSTVALSILPFIARRLISIRFFGRFPLIRAVADLRYSKIRISLGVIAIVVAFTVFWTGLITETGGNFRHVFTDAVESVRFGFGDGARSSEALRMLSLEQRDAGELLDEFVKEEIHVIRDKTSLYLAEATPERYPIEVAEPVRQPYTVLGESIAYFGVDPARVASSIGGFLGKCVQLFALVGLIAVFLAARRTRLHDPEFYVFAVLCGVFIVLVAVVPVLSIEYGILRAIQQSLLIVGPLIACGSAVMGAWGVSLLLGWSNRPFPDSSLKWARRSAHALPAILVILLFVFSTGAVATAVGGNVPPLHLANSGNYYDLHYTTRADVEAIAWLSSTYEGYVLAGMPYHFDLQIDSFARNRLVAFSDVPYTSTIFPYLIKKDAYVYVPPVTTREGYALMSAGGRLISYTYPIELLDEQKDLVYTNGSVKIYR